MLQGVIIVNQARHRPKKRARGCGIRGRSCEPETLFRNAKIIETRLFIHLILNIHIIEWRIVAMH
jgi:hypothetical protein